ncbi:hypothetical protein AAFC00_006891 [Neodothiora populina]|uniref:FAM50A/XAP5 C-terminal domain-containing protein n=1 Tax=Neodothiora populina TaxID=2781224 RepID=A0ABR3PCT3_9PEZI
MTSNNSNNNNNAVSAASSGNSTPNARFVSQNTAAEDLLKSQTVGLVHLDDFRKRRAEAIDVELGAPSGSGGSINPVFKKKKRKTVKKGALSFDHGQDESEVAPPDSSRDQSESPGATAATPTSEAESDVPTKKRLAANTNVGFQAKSMSKSALLRETQAKEQLRKAFLLMQERVKATDFMIPFVFYAGKDYPGGACRMKKGDLVWLFLDRARKVGAEVSNSDRSRKEWARVSVDDLMLVRGDLIIPHHYEFYHFMLNKTIGYDGVLFPYSAEPTAASPADTGVASTPGGLSVPDPSTQAAAKAASAQPPTVPDAELEGFDTPASLTKVVDRRWYEKNKHIYPASTWEEFDPTRDYSTGIRKDTQGNAFFFSRR